MRYLIYVVLLLSVSTVAFGGTGVSVTYQVNGQSYEGYYISPADRAPFVLLIHDWDGLTDYEIKRADMLADLGYAVFALDLFGAGVRPTELNDKRQHTGDLYKNREKMRALMKGALDTAGVAHEMITYSGAQHAFTVFGGKRYQEAADKKSWKRFTEFLADTLKN
jgi:dienelactone hydrolase